jgi:hypothetical protein
MIPASPVSGLFCGEPLSRRAASVCNFAVVATRHLPFSKDKSLWGLRTFVFDIQQYNLAA